MITIPRSPSAPGVVALVTVIVAATSCNRSLPTAAPAAVAVEPRTSVHVGVDDAAAAGIETAPARIVERAEPLQAAGVVGFDERRTARLGALVEGVVDELRVQVGDRVGRGAILLYLHSHVVHDAWAGYFKSIAELRRSEAELTYVRTSEARAAELVADRALSPQELQRARTDVNAATQAVAAARAEITRFEQELDHYGITATPDGNPADQREVPVRSPIAGTVIERLATEGMAVTPGTPLLVVSDLSRVWVLGEIDEKMLGRVTTGAVASITAGAYGADVFTGTLTAIGDVVNPATRRVTLRIEAPNADRRLKPQMFVTVSLGAAAPRRVLVVPSRAVQSIDGEQVVFVRTAGDRFERRAVTTGSDVSGEVEIVSGLGEGEVIATAGAFLLKSELTRPAGDKEP
jgi:cobalt-zinc-cadmium efflux system membrane fusion protein